MGKLEVSGNASKTVDYDLMKIELDFHAKEKTATEASAFTTAVRRRSDLTGMSCHSHLPTAYV